jgi:sialate O-acetylesterase
MLTHLFRLILPLLITLSASGASLRLPALISDNMVLQCDRTVPIWGWAEPGQQVRVVLGDQTKTTVADVTGHWRVSLDALPAGGPYEMTVSADTELKVHNIAAGEVWLCSGQSNMAFMLQGSTKGPETVANSTNPNLRHFKVEGPATARPLDNTKGRWELSAPDVAGKFTAVGYYFGRRIQSELGVPVGLINASVGGTPVEAWTSYEALSVMPKVKAETDAKLARLQGGFPKANAAYQAQLNDWQQRLDRHDVRGVPAETFLSANTADWPTVQLLGVINPPSGKLGGSVWLRRDVTIPRDPAGVGYWAVDVATPTGLHEVFWNGTSLGSLKDIADHVSFTGGMRRYVIPNHLVRQGVNDIAIRIFNPGEELGILGNPSRLRVVLNDHGTESTLPLTGAWKYQMERALPPLDAAARAAYPDAPEKPPIASQVGSTLFNGIIHPLIPYAMRGAIWYQGESNTDDPQQYRESFPALINDWRARWREGDFPFYFCQLPGFYDPKPDPNTPSNWAALREAQTMTLSLPNTRQAVLIDLGEARNIHPHNKSDVGERLARIALADTYGRDLVSSGPVFAKMTVESGTARIHFNGTDGGLVVGDIAGGTRVPGQASSFVPPTEGALKGFSICGADRKWVWANARIDGDTVVVSAPSVASPVAVRYAWADNPVCNLYNQAGLPASPFRTDPPAAR